MNEHGLPIGMAVNSFTSVSLSPPLVAFWADLGSSTFPKIRAAEKFCANVMAQDQAELCKALLRPSEIRFRGVRYRTSEGGSPILEGVAAWIDCRIESLSTHGDHTMCVGRVYALGGDSTRKPLIFHSGSFTFVADPPKV